MTIQKATAGNQGAKVRSDCFVTLELTSSGGIQLSIQSKVAALYGKSIEQLCREVLAFFEIKNAVLSIDDQGALPFVIAARLEAVIRKLKQVTKEFLLPMADGNQGATDRLRDRVSRLYLPGNTPSLMINGGIHGAHGIILDLEDAVAAEKKDEAKILVRNALRALDFIGAERMVRINPSLADLDWIVPHHVNLILIPKCENAAQIISLNARIAELQKDKEGVRPIWLMPIIESAMGVVKSFEIATAADNIAAMAIGLEDYTADMGVRRTRGGTESFFARGQVLHACKAAGVQAIDSVFSDVGDDDGLRETALRSKALGFEGMGCIHPRQIKIIHASYAPSHDEILDAQKIVDAFTRAAQNGLGVVSLGTKMIDAPVVKRAHRTLERARSMGILNAPQHP